MKRKSFLLCVALVWVLAAVGMSAYPAPGHCGTKHLRFTTVAWEPYYGPNLLNQGYVTEITKEALKRVGYSMEIDFVPWKRALHDTRNGYYDAILGLYFSDERATWLAYSEKIASVQVVFFTRKGRSIRWENLVDLKPYTIGTGMGWVYTDAFDAADFLKKEPVRKIELNLRKLLENRIDLIAASRNVFLHWVKKDHPDKLDEIAVVPKPLSENKIFNGFRKSNPQYKRYLMDFNRGLQVIKADGTFDSILKKHGFN